MIQLELPHLNVLTKCDLVDEDALERILDFESASMLLDSSVMDSRPVTDELTHCVREEPGSSPGNSLGSSGGCGGGGARLARLTRAITSLLDDFTMLAFVPLNLKDEESVALVLHAAQQLTQFGEDLEPREMADGDD